MLEIYRTDVLMCAENTIDYANILYIFLRKMGNYNIEHIACILIDGNFKLIEAALTGRGNVESAKSDCDTVLKRAKSLNAKYVISAHNHPSGNLCASKADIDALKYNKEFYSEEGINFIDALIVANDKDGNFGVYSVSNDFKIEYKPNSNYKMYCDKTEKEIRIKAIKNEGMAKAWNIYSRWEEESLGKITTPKDRNNILANIFKRSSQLFNRDGLLEIYRTSKDKIIQVNCYAEIYNAIEKCSSSPIYSNERSRYILLDNDDRLLEVIVDSYNTNVFLSKKLPMMVKRAKAIRAKKLIKIKKDIIKKMPLQNKDSLKEVYTAASDEIKIPSANEYAYLISKCRIDEKVCERVGYILMYNEKFIEVIVTGYDTSKSIESSACIAAARAKKAGANRIVAFIERKKDAHPRKTDIEKYVQVYSIFNKSAITVEDFIVLTQDRYGSFYSKAKKRVY